MVETSGRKRKSHLEPTLPGSAYTDPAHLEREWDTIFYRSWLCAGRESQVRLPGDYVTLQAGRENIIITRGKEGALHAFYNVCRHRGSRLCDQEKGSFGGAIRCPYHAWTYGLDGRLVGTPHVKEGDELSREEFPLHPVNLETWEGFLFINLDDRPRPLAAQLGDIPPRVHRYALGALESDVVKVDEVAANWKLLVENYQECYHCPGIHPELCDLVPLYRRGIVDGLGGEIAEFRDGAMTFTLTGTSRRPHLPGLSEEDKRRYNGELVLPNMFLNLFPDYAHTRMLWPMGPGRTRIVSEWLFEPSTRARADFDSSDAVDFVQKVGWQDWSVCERVQEGVGSRAFRHGVYLPQESYAADFKRWIVEQYQSR